MSILGHCPLVSRAGSTLVMVQLTESSSISSRADAHRMHRVLGTSPLVLTGATGAAGSFTGRPVIPRRKLAQKAPFFWGVHTSGISLTGVGESRICHVLTVFVQIHGCV